MRRELGLIRDTEAGRPVAATPRASKRPGPNRVRANGARETGLDAAEAGAGARPGGGALLPRPPARQGVAPPGGRLPGGEGCGEASTAGEGPAGARRRRSPRGGGAVEPWASAPPER